MTYQNKLAQPVAMKNDFLEAWVAECGGNPFPPPEEMVGRYPDKGIIIVGDAACVWDDLERFGCKVTHRKGCVAKDGFDFLTINRAVQTFPGNIEHAYSNQPDILEGFIKARRSEYRKEFAGPMHTHSCNKGAKWHWPWGGWGSSGLGATFCASYMYGGPIVLCGVPLDDGPHNGEPHWRKTTFTREAADTKDGKMNRFWKMGRNALGPRLSSMSGRTRDWFGEPK